MASSAKRSSEEPHDDKVDLFIAKFQSEYSDAISTAREAAQTTATAAWQSNYRINIDGHRKAIKTSLEVIEGECSSIEARDTNEAAEKEIRDAVKELADERVRFGAWRQRAVEVYRATATRCQGIVESATRHAQDDERDNPLLNIGLLLAVKERLDSWPRAEWDDETGAVVIVETK